MIQIEEIVDGKSYKDETEYWIDIVVPTSKVRVTEVVDMEVKTEHIDQVTGQKSKRKSRLRYATVAFDVEDKRIKGREFYAYNRYKGESFVAFSQLAGKIRDGIDGFTADDLKRISSGYTGINKTKIKGNPHRVKEILNKGLQKADEILKFRVNPEESKLECVVSPKYTPITNKELFVRINEVFGPVKVIKQFHRDSKSLFQILPEKFAHLSDTEQFGSFFSNSFRAGSSVGLGEFAVTVICGNGMMVVGKDLRENSTVFSELKRKHMGETTHILEMFSQGLLTIESHLKVLYEQIEEAKEIEFPFQIELQEEYDFLTPVKESLSLSAKTSKQVEELLKTTYTDNTLWDFISALTEAAQDLPDHSRENLEKTAGEVLNLYIPTPIVA